MKVAKRSCFLGLLFCMAIAASTAGAQVTLSVPPVVELKAAVPAILLLSVGNSIDNSLSLVGVLGGWGTPDRGQAPGTRRFRIQPGEICDLGSLNLFSNVPDWYKIVVYSRNEGLLLPEDMPEGPKQGISYRLRLGDLWCVGINGIFEYGGHGKTPKGGVTMDLALMVDEIPHKKEPGQYSDSLLFTIVVE